MAKKYPFDLAELCDEMKSMRHEISWQGHFMSKDALAKRYGLKVSVVKSVENGNVKPNEEDFVAVAKMVLSGCREYRVEVLPEFTKYLKWAREKGIDI